jgi:hypothetical protein
VTYIVYDINIDSGSRRTVWRKLVRISFSLKNNYDVDPDPLGTVPATLLDFGYSKQWMLTIYLLPTVDKNARLS